ncbi:MAG: hypothetical protein ACYCU0_03670 [Solirubrobacteraceae bacterium]
MQRLAVFVVALAGILGFAVLTAYELVEQGVTVLGVVALIVLVFLSVTLIGALLHGPRE